uniref:Uncharacterized mitochondrial protein AtMg00810-like n=1 Tax=Tanacetum cinerariifolium TaxID=118510 RepID=A0A699I137_TANCI|nr:uncharacterized mitochondrial protein AtMg00810-like [Tanacetum cinerariifolium]
MYLIASIPDLVFTVCMCARYQASPTKKHLEALKWVFRYLKGTINWGLWYPKDTAIALTAYTDADHAVRVDQERIVKRVPTSSYGVLLLQSWAMQFHKLFQLAYDVHTCRMIPGWSSSWRETCVHLYIVNEKRGPKEDECIMSYQSQGVAVWLGAEVVHLQAGVFKERCNQFACDAILEGDC